MLPSEGEGSQDRLHYRLFIDGEERWNVTISTPFVEKDEKQRDGGRGSSFWDIFKRS